MEINKKKKMTQQVEMGLLHFCDDSHHQVRTRHGGGTRSLAVQKTVTMGQRWRLEKTCFIQKDTLPKKRCMILVLTPVILATTDY